MVQDDFVSGRGKRVLEGLRERVMLDKRNVLRSFASGGSQFAADTFGYTPSFQWSENGNIHCKGMTVW